MSTTQPIRDGKEIKELKNYFLLKKQYRNYVMVTIGLNTALRISDILRLKWKDVYNFEKHNFYSYLHVREQKTNKFNQIAINQAISKALSLLIENSEMFSENQYLFYGQKNKNTPISRIQAYRIIRAAANTMEIEGCISCHSLRKTFGYHAWKTGAEPALIMNIYNHSSYQITKRYLGIEQDDKDSLFFKINL